MNIIRKITLLSIVISLSVFLSSCGFGTGGGKWGFIDKLGNVVIPPQFDEVTEDRHSGWNDIRNKLFRNFSEELAAVRKGNKWGYIDKTGKFVIQPQYDDAGIFSEGLACVRNANKYGYLDKTGNIVIPLKLDWAAPEYISHFEFNDGRALFRIKSGKCGYIDRRGQVIIAAKYYDAGPFSDGIARVNLSGTAPFIVSYIDTAGQVLFECRVGDPVCSEGMIVISNTNQKFNYVNKLGKKVFDRDFTSAARFSEGLAAISLNTINSDPLWGPELGYIDTTGKVVIQPRFHIPGNWSAEFIEGRAIATSMGIKPSKNMGFDSIGNMSIFCGFIDKTGKWVIEPKYEFLSCFHGGLARATWTGNHGIGFLDRDGKIAIEPKFRRVNSFSEGLAAFWVNQ